jgi:enamine deaminase RidA (YjgF/YER057c/UK114 family)
MRSRRELLSALGVSGVGSLIAIRVGRAEAESARSAPATVGVGDSSDTPAPIERFEATPARPGIPRISYATSHGDVVYLAGITAAPQRLGDVKEQTRDVLARIDDLLAAAGTDKSRLLTAQVWLTDMKLFADHNDAWNEWVDPRNAPVRACLLSPQLWRPGMLVEIMVTAAR